MPSLLTVPLAAALAAAYALVPSLALGVVAVTVVLHLATFPLTSRAHDSQRRLAELGPELAALRRRHAGDPAAARAASAARLRDAGISPFAAVVPLLVQAPAFFGFFAVLRDLARGSAEAAASGSSLAAAVRRGQALRCWGVDLGQTGLAALGASPWAAVAALALIAIVVGAGVCQQRRSRRAGAATADDTGMGRVTRRLQLVLPLLSVGAVLTLPLLVTVMTATAAVCRFVQLVAVQRLSG